MFWGHMTVFLGQMFGSPGEVTLGRYAAAADFKGA